MWVNVNEQSLFELRAGSTVFVGEICPQGKASYMECRRAAYHTNMSLKPTLHGWVGETNNVSRFARGVGVVVRTADDGERALVRMLRGSAAREAFERWVAADAKQWAE